MQTMIFAALLAAFSFPVIDARADSTNPAAGPFPVVREGRWGVVDAAGAEIIPAEYDSATIWSDGLIYVRKNELAALFSSDGSLLVPLRYEVLYGNDTMAGGSHDNSWFWAHNQWGRERWIVGVGGEPLLGPGLNPLTPFDGKDRFIVDDNGEDGILSLACEWILPPSLGAIGTLADNGLAWAQTFDRKHGFIDANGEWVIEPGRFERLGYFADDGWAPAQESGKWGFIDASGAWMIPPLSEDDFQPQPFNAQGVTAFKAGGKWGFVDRTGEWIGEPVFDGIVAYADGSFIVHRDGERRRFSAAAEDLGPAPFDASDFVRYDESRTGRTVLDGKAVLVDWSGSEVIGEGFEDVLPFESNDWAPARKGGKWGAVNRAGEWVLRPEYECVGRCPLRQDMVPQTPVVRSLPPTTQREPVRTQKDPRYTDPKSQAWCHAPD